MSSLSALPEEEPAEDTKTNLSSAFAGVAEPSPQKQSFLSQQRKQLEQKDARIAALEMQLLAAATPVPRASSLRFPPERHAAGHNNNIKMNVVASTVLSARARARRVLADLNDLASPSQARSFVSPPRAAGDHAAATRAPAPVNQRQYVNDIVGAVAAHARGGKIITPPTLDKWSIPARKKFAKGYIAYVRAIKRAHAAGDYSQRLVPPELLLAEDVLTYVCTFVSVSARGKPCDQDYPSEEDEEWLRKVALMTDFSPEFDQNEEASVLAEITEMDMDMGIDDYSERVRQYFQSAIKTVEGSSVEISNYKLIGCMVKSGIKPAWLQHVIGGKYSVAPKTAPIRTDVYFLQKQLLHLSAMYDTIVPFVLKQHGITPKSGKKKKPKRDASEITPQRLSSRPCANCLSPDHDIYGCAARSRAQMGWGESKWLDHLRGRSAADDRVIARAAKMEKRGDRFACFLCGGPHMASKCEKRSEEQKKWTREDWSRYAKKNRDKINKGVYEHAKSTKSAEPTETTTATPTQTAKSSKVKKLNAAPEHIKGARVEPRIGTPGAPPPWYGPR